MSRYYERYDIFGEPQTILLPVQSYPAGEPMEPRRRFVDEIARCNDADDLYEKLREDGRTHAEARAIVAERFSV